MSWSWAAVMPHPPIIIPEVGQGREREALITLEGMAKLTERLGEAEMPERLLLISPHQPYTIGAFSFNRAPAVRGSLAPFGAPSLVFDLRTPLGDIERLSSFLAERKVSVGFKDSHDLTRDQGAIVPLYFLEECYDGLPPVILANAIGLDVESAFRAGRALAGFDDGRRWALVASGDLSHRLKPGAPAGYSPSGEVFDAAIVRALESGNADLLRNMPAHVVEEAGECGLRSIMVLLGLLSVLSGTVRVFSYEGPFGVGYCNALLMRE